MIVQQEFLTKLKDFGLNTYESKLWVALLSRGSSTAGELSDIARVPRSRSYDVLESLERKGFIIMKLGKPIKYIAVPPEAVIERVKKKVKEGAEKQIKTMNELKTGDVLHELNSLHTQGSDLIDPTDLIGYIKGRDNLYNHIETMLRKAKTSVVITTTEQGLKRKSKDLEQAFAKAKQRNIKIKIAAPITKENYSDAKKLSKYVTIKHSDLKSRFIVVDGTEMMFMLMDDSDVHESYDSGVWVNSSLFVSAFEKAFENSWQIMKSI